MARTKIAKADHISHLTERGSLIKFVYDTEIYNLDREFPGVYDFGAVIKDLAGNEIGAPVFYLRQPKDCLHSIVSNLITRTPPEDHPEAVDFATFVGKIAHTLDRYYEYTWDRYRDEQKIKYVNKGNQKENDEVVRLFPIEQKDGSISHIRLHDGGEKISFPVPEDSQKYTYTDIDAHGNQTKWRKIHASAEMRGYANTSADDPWLQSTLYTAVFPEIYKTHTKAEHKFRQDLFKATIGHLLWGDTGENGLKAGSRHHPIKNAPVISLKQSDLIPANTRMEGAFHDRGIHMDNKSDYDPRQAHGTITDAKGTSAVEDAERDINPVIARHFELMADPAYAREFLMKGEAGQRRGFNDTPLRAFGSYSLADGVTSHLGMCVETDERFGNRNKLLWLKLDTDWDHILYNGKRLLDIRHGKTLERAVRTLFFEKNAPYRSLLQQEHIKKTPVVWDADKAVAAGAHSSEEYRLAIRNRQKIRKNRNLTDALMSAYEDGLRTYAPTQNKYAPLDDQFKEHFTGDRDFFEVEIGDGQTKVIDERSEVYYHAALQWAMDLKMDQLLQNLVRPHAIEWCDDTQVPRELQRFNKVLDKARSEIYGNKGYNNRMNTGHLPRPSYALPTVDTLDQETPSSDCLKTVFTKSSGEEGKKLPETQAEAKAYIRKLRFEALWAHYNDDPSMRFNDNGWRVEVVDRDGHKVDWEAYHAMPQKDRAAKWTDGDFDVRLASNLSGHTPRRLAFMMCRSGEMDDLVKTFANLARTAPADARQDYLKKLDCLFKYQDLYEAYCAIRLHGYPHLSAEEQPFLTIEKDRRQTFELLHNVKMGTLHLAKMEDIGALEFLAEDKEEAERFLTRHLAYLGQKEREVPPPTPAQYRLMGVDPLTGAALPFIRYQVAPDKTIEIKAPEKLCDTMMSHDDIGTRFTIVELPEGQSLHDMQSHLTMPRANLVLAGEKTGERRLAAKAKLLPLWDKSDDPYFSRILLGVQKAYTDIGKTMPERGRLAIIKMEDNPRIAGLRGDGKFVNTSLQTLHAEESSARKLFTGMLSRKLGNVRDHITGLIINSNYIKQDLDRGPIRIREVDETGQTTGREFEHTVTRVLKLNMRKIMSAMTVLDQNPAIVIDTLALDAVRDYGFNDKAEMAQYLGALSNPDRYGYTDRLGMFDALVGMFNKDRHDVMAKPEKYNITVVHLKKDTTRDELRNTMTYFNLYRRPKAAISEFVLAQNALDDQHNLHLYSGAYPSESPNAGISLS